MIPEPQPYDPDDPDIYDETGEDLAYLVPGRMLPGNLVDPDDPMTY
jgi:hypothetical protein